MATSIIKETKNQPHFTYEIRTMLDDGSGNLTEVSAGTYGAEHAVYEASTQEDDLNNNLPMWIADFSKMEDAVLFKDLKTNLAFIKQHSN